MRSASPGGDRSRAGWNPQGRRPSPRGPSGTTRSCRATPRPGCRSRRTRRRGARSRRRGRGGRPRLLQRKKGRARAGEKGGGVRPRAPPGGEETPRGSPRGGRRPWLSGPTRGTSDSGSDKAAAYTHATSRRNRRAKGVLGHQEFPVADDRLAVRFDGRRTDRAFESERGLVGAADELVPSDSDRDGAPHDRVLKETERGLRVRSDGERGDAIPVSR